jgi:hypothetical protein
MFEDDLPDSALFRTSEIVYSPSIASWKDWVDANASDMDSEVAQRNVVLDGFCLCEQDGVCDN